MSMNIKLLVLALAAMTTTALANDLYMDQVGDGADIQITQDGTDNRIKGTGATSTDPAILHGDGIVARITQTGTSNTLNLYVDHPGAGINLTSSVDGSDNVQTINCGSAAGQCNATTLTQTIVGSSNIVTQTIDGGTTSSVIDITGSYNTVTHTAAGTGAHTASITSTASGVQGTPHTISLDQSGTSAKHATITSSGNSNAVTIIQRD